MPTPSLPTPHILCIGDLILDQFCYGEVTRISPEAPVPVIHIHRQFTTLGGAGNVVRNLHALSADITFLSSIGNDAHGLNAQNLIAETTRVKAHLVYQHKTTCKTRFIAQTQQLLRVDDELITPLPLEQQKKLMSHFVHAIPQADFVILSDYKKGLLSPSICQQIIKCAKKYHKPVIIDPKGTDYTPYTGATIITPNLKELRDVSGSPVKTTAEIVEAAQSLIAQYRFEAVLVTRSADGMTLIQQNGTVVHIETKAQDVYDVSGAGDTVICALTVALARGHTLEEAAKIANIAAGIVVSKAGTAITTWEEIEQFMRTRKPSGKIVDRPQLFELAQKWRHQNLKIGFTNGCFDLLHLGHLHILQAAKKTCDRLIVALNTDASIQQLKGINRPVHQEDVRSNVLAALEVVDAVVLFGEQTPLTLIESIIPDVLIKGADYTVDQVVGADIVIKNGGHVHLVTLLDGHSTTNLIAKIAS